MGDAVVTRYYVLAGQLYQMNPGFDEYEPGGISVCKASDYDALARQLDEAQESVKLRRNEMLEAYKELTEAQQRIVVVEQRLAKATAAYVKMADGALQTLQLLQQAEAALAKAQEG